jgi:hypothetical protein
LTRVKSFLDITILPEVLAYLGFVGTFFVTATLLIAKARKDHGRPWGDEMIEKAGCRN